MHESSQFVGSYNNPTKNQYVQ